MTSRWRDRARPIIARVLEETAGQDERAIRLALRKAYPFGERAMHPYRIWCDEIARQRRTGKYTPPSSLPLLERIAEIEEHNQKVDAPTTVDEMDRRLRDGSKRP